MEESGQYLSRVVHLWRNSFFICTIARNLTVSSSCLSKTIAYQPNRVRIQRMTRTCNTMLTISAVAVCGTLLTICSIPVVTSRRLLFSSGPVTARNRARSVALGSSSIASLAVLWWRQEYSSNESFCVCEGRRYKAVHNVGELSEDMPKCHGHGTQ